MLYNVGHSDHVLVIGFSYLGSWYEISKAREADKLKFQFQFSLKDTQGSNIISLFQTHLAYKRASCSRQIWKLHNRCSKMTYLNTSFHYHASCSERFKHNLKNKHNLISWHHEIPLGSDVKVSRSPDYLHALNLKMTISQSFWEFATKQKPKATTLLCWILSIANSELSFYTKIMWLTLSFVSKCCQETSEKQP